MVLNIAINIHASIRSFAGCGSAVWYEDDCGSAGSQRIVFECPEFQG